MAGLDRKEQIGKPNNIDNKLGLSCAKLRPAWASYQLAFVWLTYTKAQATYYA